MLFDPFEKQFDMPAIFVSLAMVMAGKAKLLVRNTNDFPLVSQR
jgi:hypothetical protein